jgi:assimilatory nitrate reductase catalytic subunit
LETAPASLRRGHRVAGVAEAARGSKARWHSRRRWDPASAGCSSATTCPYCGVRCSILAAPDGRGGVAIAGDPDHPANFGRLCSKGSALGQTVSLEGRLLAPRIRGRARARRLLRLRPAPHDDYYVANKLMKGFIGAANIATNSRLCMASSVAGHRRAFGSDTVPGTYEDLERADLVRLGQEVRHRHLHPTSGGGLPGPTM